MTGGHVIFGGVRRGRTIIYAAPVSLDRPPTRLGGAHAFVPSSTAGRVWLAGRGVVHVGHLAALTTHMVGKAER